MAHAAARKTALAEILTGSALDFMPVWQTSAIDWQALTPFAAWLIEVARPRTLVELGVYRGDSYCAMCQAVAEHETGTRAWGVDTWTGDEHVGEYGTEVLDTLRDHHDPRYAHFSRLLQMTFDEALDQFDDGSVDLLHIDGLHTYAAVKHDFESWRPKLSDRAVVLFHDTAVRERGFGVWKFWREIAKELPGRHFHLPFSNGLGIAVFDPDPPAPLRALVEAPAGPADLYARMFKTLGDRIVAEAKIRYWRSQAESPSGLRAGEREALVNDLRADFDNKVEIMRKTLLTAVRAEFDNKYISRSDFGDFIDSQVTSETNPLRDLLENDLRGEFEERIDAMREALVKDLRADADAKYAARKDLADHVGTHLASGLAGMRESLANDLRAAFDGKYATREAVDAAAGEIAGLRADVQRVQAALADAASEAELRRRFDRLAAGLDEQIASLRAAGEEKEGIQDHEIHALREMLEHILQHPIFR